MRRKHPWFLCNTFQSPKVNERCHRDHLPSPTASLSKVSTAPAPCRLAASIQWCSCTVPSAPVASPGGIKQAEAHALFQSPLSTWPSEHASKQLQGLGHVLPTVPAWAPKADNWFHLGTSPPLPWEHWGPHASCLALATVLQPDRSLHGNCFHKKVPRNTGKYLHQFRRNDFSSSTL